MKTYFLFVFSILFAAISLMVFSPVFTLANVPGDSMEPKESGDSDGNNGSSSEPKEDKKEDDKDKFDSSEGVGGDADSSATQQICGISNEYEDCKKDNDKDESKDNDNDNDGDSNNNDNDKKKSSSNSNNDNDDEDEVLLSSPVALIESIVETPDGTEIVTYSNGTVLITSPNGNSVKINPSAINIQVQKTIINETDKTSKTFVADPISYTNTETGFDSTDDRIFPQAGDAQCSSTQQICGIENEDNENTNTNENVAGSAAQP
jgi:hypothetical protein